MSADAAAALRYAASLDVIDTNRVGYFGSSKAGWVVPPAAIDAEEAAFQILRSGAALTPVETYLHEVRQELRAEGLSGLGLDSAMALRREVYRLASRGAPIDEADVLVVIADAPHSFIIEDEAGNPRYAEGFFSRMASWMAERGISNEACWEN